MDNKSGFQQYYIWYRRAQQGLPAVLRADNALQRLQRRTQVSAHVSERHAAPEGCQVGVVDRWRQGHRPGAAGKGVAEPAQQNSL